MTDEPMDVNSREAALWSETMSLKSRNEWLEAEIERQRQYIAELEDLHCFKELRADNERLRVENANILKAVLHHFGPEGANKVCTSALDARAALEPKP